MAVKTPSKDRTTRPKQSLQTILPNVGRLSFAIAILGLGVLLILRANGGKSPQPATAAMGRTAKAKAAATTTAPSDAEFRRLVLGTWQDDYQGRRMLTVRDDGTATMLVEFDGWKARMFTPWLRIQTTWSIVNGHFNRTITGGEPSDKVDFVRKRVGDDASDTIVAITDNRMSLVDQDGSTRYQWQRVK